MNEYSQEELMLIEKALIRCMHSLETDYEESDNDFAILSEINKYNKLLRKFWRLNKGTSV